MRCSRTQPCANCAQADYACEYRDADTKRRPVSRDYVASLESRVACLEALLVKLQNAAPADRDSILAEVNTPVALLPSTAAGDEPSRASRHFQAEREEEALVYHGPTSIYYIRTKQPASKRIIGGTQGPEPPGVSPAPDTARDKSLLSDVAQHFGIDMQGPVVTTALVHFFQWQYPHFMFIYREAFLRDHFAAQRERDPTSNTTCTWVATKYWSGPLLFAICALGLVGMPADGPTCRRDQSERFFAAAESILLVSGLSEPSITNVQAFLCLAYYEIGRGNLSKGWGFSGTNTRPRVGA